LVSAPVGTGKTTILSERVITALNAGIKPEEILCLTFTNRAAEEMMNKVKASIGKKEIYELLTVKTFHGFCAYFIKSEAKRVGVNTDYVIFDKTEQVETMKNILEEYPEYTGGNGRENAVASDILDKVYHYRLNKIEREANCEVPPRFLDEKMIEMGEKYRKSLEEQNALDFNELVILTFKTLYQDKEARKKWNKKFKLIQLDEFQDTHLSEYLIVKELAKGYKNIAFIGDLDQTIYEWRGSRPFFIKKLIEFHFPDLTEVYLDTNYRFNKNILEAVSSFLKSFNDPKTGKLEAPAGQTSEPEPCIEVFEGYNLREEVDWIIENIKELREKEPEARMAVLARSNGFIKRVSDIFKEKGVEHVTLDQFEFFRRQEIKDIYAYIKLIFNKFDLESAYRAIRRPARNIGPATIKNIREKGGEAGIKVSDFLDFKNFSFSEPFAGLISKFDNGRIVVLDTETTGTDVLKDEIIQIFAIEVVNGKPGKEFHCYVKNSIPVGASAEVHELTDEFLQKNGMEPKKALQELKKFVDNSITVGHNINFDLSMIEENSRRNNIMFNFKEYYDTLDLSRRLVESENYKLTTLAEKLGLTVATHDARDDVLATVDLLAILVERLKEKQSQRAEIFQEYSKKFIKLSSQIKRWKKAVKENRPAEALEYIWEDSGLKDYYAQDSEKEKREASIKTLVKFFNDRDNPDRPADIALRELINFGSLNKDITFLGLDKGKVPVVTVHQAKGLEFDYVFLVGLNDSIFPVNKDNSEEEKRLFYVAMTRAKKKIYASYSNFNDYGYPLNRSPFIGYIDEKYIKWIK
jgi:DNA helicase-2/ATP-dependent DNA helicase PcrA